MKPDKLINNAPDLRSEMEKRLDERKRKTFEVEIPDILGASGKSLGTIRMRSATIVEQEDARKKAYDYAKTHESLKEDESFSNIDIIHILHKVCLNGKEDSELPAFSGPRYMSENFGTSEIAILLNHYHEIERVLNKDKFVFDTETLKAFAKNCSDFSDNDAPNMYLQRYARNDIAEIAIRIGILYHQLLLEKSKEQELEEEVERLKERIKQLELPVELPKAQRAKKE